ncbi:MAG: hypothetical protein ACRDID_14850, partial [Ktedonobacterales bacterium]
LAHAIAPAALACPASAGQLYLAPLSAIATMEAVVQRGAHACLLPPWPVGGVTLGGVTLGVAEVEQRGEAHATATLAAQPLTILYRERLFGALGVTLVESGAGEPLLSALPRASNRHGYLLVTTLQLSIASAQTRLDDVAWLIRRLLTWLASHSESASQTALEGQAEADQQRLVGDAAPLVALALALLPSEAQRGERSADDAIQDDIQMAARNAFDRVCQALGLAADPELFEAGWGWLAGHGVLRLREGELAQVDAQALERVNAMWQLGPRLRRLRRAAGLTS